VLRTGFEIAEAGYERQKLTDTVEKVDLSTDDMVIGQNQVLVSCSWRIVVALRAVIEEAFPHSSSRRQPRERYRPGAALGLVTILRSVNLRDETRAPSGLLATGAASH
jgi:hypothetical protein